MSKPASLRSFPHLTALLAMGCVFSLALLALPVARADTGVPMQPRADMAKALPLTATFEKTASTDAPPFVLKLKNDSHAAIKATGTVLLSVVYHSADKARHLPEHVIEPGQVWSIGELAALDQVVITAEGFAPLKLTVPGKK